MLPPDPQKFAEIVRGANLQDSQPLQQAWERREVLPVEQVARLLGDSSVDPHDIFDSTVLAGMLARRAGSAVTYEGCALPDPRLKIGLSAEQYYGLVAQQRGPGPRHDKAAEAELLYGHCCLFGAGFSMLTGFVGLFTCSPWALWGLVPAGGSLATSYYAWRQSERPAAPTCAGMVSQTLYAGAPEGADRVFTALRAAGSIADVAQAASCYRLSSLNGIEAAVDEHIAAPRRSEVVDHLKVIFAEGRRAEMPAKVAYLQREAQRFLSRAATPSTAANGYQALAGDAAEPDVAGYEEAASILLAKAAEVERTAEAYGDLLQFRDAPHEGDAAYLLRRRLQAAGKSPDYIARSVRQMAVELTARAPASPLL